jgi:hypothetical protein
VSQDGDISDRQRLESPLTGAGMDSPDAPARLTPTAHIAASWGDTTGFDV